MTVNGATAVLDLGSTTQTQNGGVALQAGGTIQNGTLSSSGTFAVESGSVSAVLAGTGGVSKTTDGTVTFSGANTYTGSTNITAGTLALSGAGTLGATTNSVTVNGATAVLDLGTTTQTQNGGVTLQAGGTIQNGTLSSSGSFAVELGSVSAVLAGTGGVSKTTAGTVTFSGANTYTGNTSITGRHAGAVGRRHARRHHQFRDGERRRCGSRSRRHHADAERRRHPAQRRHHPERHAVVDRHLRLHPGVGQRQRGARRRRQPQKDTAGTVTLSGANTYSGSTRVNAGTLALSGAGTLGATSNSVSVDGALLDLGGTTQTQNLGVNLETGGTIQNGTLSSSGRFAVQRGSASAALAGSADVTKSGGGATVTLSGANTYSGSTTITDGTLALSGAGTLGATTNSVTLNGASAVLELGGTAQTQNGGVILATAPPSRTARCRRAAPLPWSRAASALTSPAPAASARPRPAR